MADLFRRLDLLPVIPVPRNLTNRAVSIHVKDVVRAASFVAQQETCKGQEYNLTDDGLYSTRAFLSLIASALDKKTVPVVIPRSVVRASAWTAALGSLALSRLLKSRPWIEKDTASYLTSDFPLSNQKIKSLGFSFLYPDPAQGIPEVVQALRQEGFL